MSKLSLIHSVFTALILLGLSSPSFAALRTLPNSTVNASGWTNFKREPGSRNIFVDCKAGKTNWPGSKLHPKRSIRAAYESENFRDGHGDWILVKRGTSCRENLSGWKKSGSPSYVMGVGTYGDGPRPVLLTGSDGAISFHGSVQNVTFRGLYLVADSRNYKTFKSRKAGLNRGVGIFADGFASKIDGVSFEDIVVDSYTSGVDMGNNNATFKNIIFRRSSIVNSYPEKVNAISNGVYMANAKGILFEEVFFDANGWNDRTKTLNEGTYKDHHLYFRSDVQDVEMINVFGMRSPGDAFQLRGGGIASGTLSYKNGGGFTCGLVNGAETVHAKAGGVICRVADSIFVEGWGGYATGISLTNLRPGRTKTGRGTNQIINNLFINGRAKNGAAIKLHTTKSGGGYPEPVNEDETVGVNDLEILNNRVVSYPSFIWFDSGFNLGGKGRAALNGVRIAYNQARDPRNEKGLLIERGVTPKANLAKNGIEPIVYIGNDYYSSTNTLTGNLFSVGSDLMNLGKWAKSMEPTAGNQPLAFAKLLSPLDYHRARGGIYDNYDLQEKMLRQTETNWDPYYAVHKIRRWILSGM